MFIKASSVAQWNFQEDDANLSEAVSPFVTLDKNDSGIKENL